VTNDEIIALLGQYMDDELPEEVRRSVEKRLLADPKLAWEAETLRITRARLREGVGETVASDAFRARTLRRLYADNPHVTMQETVEETEQIRLPLRLD
jgi:anti-sigma factor RsiW